MTLLNAKANIDMESKRDDFSQSYYVTSNEITQRYSISNRRYTGSKASLTQWILGIINKECSGSSFTDIFAGTGCVAAEASKYFKQIIVNDFLHSNNIIYKAFFSQQNWNDLKLEEMKSKYNSLTLLSIKKNYYSKNFGGKYFSFNDAARIGYIRDDIENLKKQDVINDKEYNMLLTSLIYSTDKISNTVGHYDAYFKKKNIKDKFSFKLISPINMKDVVIYKEDANTLAKLLDTDIVYIDPPYNSRQYSRFYHVLETIVKNDKPKLYGTALKPEPENMSDYCRISAKDKLKDLIENLKCKYIAVSYNNTYNSKSSSSKNKIDLNEIKEILSAKGKLIVYEKKYKFFNTGKTMFNDHKEFLFLVKVGV